MDEVEKKEIDKAICSFLLWILFGFLMIISRSGTVEMDWAFAIVSWFGAFLHVLRFRYRKYDHGLWTEELMENVSLVAFVIPGFLLGAYFFGPIGFWIMCLVNIIGMSIWFVLWRLFLEDLIHGFWW